LGVVGMGVGILVWERFLSGNSVLVTALGGVLVGAIIYYLILAGLKVPELAQLVGAVRRRLVRAG
jgi:hypothetical protein